MKVQTRLSIYSSLVFGVIFLIISVLIYMFYYQNAEKLIYENLERSAYITALFFLEEDELNKDDFADVKKQFRDNVPNIYYQIYNLDNKISYGENSLLVEQKILEEIREKSKLNFSDKEFFGHGIYYEDNQGNFVVIAKEKKSVLNEQMSLLLWILGIALIAGIGIIILLSRAIAYMAYRPFRKVINQVKNISTKNLNVKIDSPETNDELQDLIETFNDLLERISETIVIQKNFVNYVSHEFKTPLASILGNLEVFLLKERTSEEYEQLAKNLIQQIYQLEEILNTLIVISDLGKDSDISTSVRIDELIWEIIDKVHQRYSKAKIKVDINILPEDETLLSVNYIETQLFMALFNLVENAVKYSHENTVGINIFKQKEKLYMSITDQGIGIPEDQLKNISKPFYRADNVKQVQGSGIGLSIALRILERNEINYSIESKIEEGTEILLTF